MPRKRSKPEMDGAWLLDMLTAAETVQGSGGAATVVKADKGMLKRRRELTRKFVAGDWGVELVRFEAAQVRDRRAAAKRARARPTGA